jgi:hypothetical protein
MLAQVQQDQRSRTPPLAEDSGSGKSYLLGRFTAASQPANRTLL